MTCLPLRRSWASCPHLGRRELHGFDDLRIGSAAAEITRQVVPDLVVVRRWMLLEQLARHQHEARCAESALGRARFQKRLLHWRELSIRCQMLDGRDRLAINEGREIEAARHGGAINEYGAATAQSLRAAFARAVEIKTIAQNLDDGLMGRDLGRNLLAVEGEVDGARHVDLTALIPAAEQPRARRKLMCPLPLRAHLCTQVA